MEPRTTSTTMGKRRALIALAVGSAAGCSAPSMVIKKPTDDDVNEAVTALWAHDVRAVAETGDWILSRSYSATGDLITFTTAGEDVSHASIYDAERGTVIEALMPVVREVPLEHLLARNHFVLVVRPTALTPTARRASVARARSAVGAEFDVLGMFGSRDDTRFYCSELVSWASGLFDPDGGVVTPAQLLDRGLPVYVSGRRDDLELQRTAMAARAMRPAPVAAAPRRSIRTAALSTGPARP